MIPDSATDDLPEWMRSSVTSSFMSPQKSAQGQLLQSMAQTQPHKNDLMMSGADYQNQSLLADVVNDDEVEKEDV